MTLSFWVSGIPAPKGSWRPVRNKRTGKTLLIPDNKRERPWAEHVSWLAKAQGARPRTGPVTVCICFYLPKPKKPTHDYPARGDLDKLARSVLDALKGIAYDDDAQVTRLITEKCWAEVGEPGARVEVMHD